MLEIVVTLGTMFVAWMLGNAISRMLKPVQEGHSGAGLFNTIRKRIIERKQANSARDYDIWRAITAAVVLLTIALAVHLWTQGRIPLLPPKVTSGTADSDIVRFLGEALALVGAICFALVAYWLLLLRRLTREGSASLAALALLFSLAIVKNDLSPVVGVFLTASATLIAGIWNSNRQKVLERKLAFVESQISDLYAPLLALLTKHEMVYKEVLQSPGFLSDDWRRRLCPGGGQIFGIAKSKCSTRTPSSRIPAHGSCGRHFSLPWNSISSPSTTRSRSSSPGRFI